MDISKTLLPEITVKLPNEKRELYTNLGLTSAAVEQIISDLELDTFLIKLVDEQGLKDPDSVKLAVSYLTSDVLAILSSDETKSFATLKPEYFVELINMLKNNDINSRIAKDLLPELFDSAVSPREIATTRNLLQISDSAALEGVVGEIIAANPSAAAEYKAGKEASIQFFVGQGMKATRGSANPAMLLEAFKKALDN
jgi:aspartyl-tRNA(Asn)/glutamyl-tRNA(Gln) amidotransferase subunit B